MTLTVKSIRADRDKNIETLNEFKMFGMITQEEYNTRLNQVMNAAKIAENLLKSNH